MSALTVNVFLYMGKVVAFQLPLFLHLWAHVKRSKMQPPNILITNILKLKMYIILTYSKDSLFFKMRVIFDKFPWFSKALHWIWHQGVWSDAGTTLGDFDGKLCKWRGLLSLLVRCGSWLWAHRTSGYLCSWLPSNCRSIVVWSVAATKEDWST